MKTMYVVECPDLDSVLSMIKLHAETNGLTPREVMNIFNTGLVLFQLENHTREMKSIIIPKGLVPNAPEPTTTVQQPYWWEKPEAKQVQVTDEVAAAHGL